MNPNEESSHARRTRTRGGRGRGGRRGSRVRGGMGRGNADAADSLVLGFTNALGMKSGLFSQPPLEVPLSAKRPRCRETSASGSSAATAAQSPAANDEPSASTSSYEATISSAALEGSTNGDTNAVGLRTSPTPSKPIPCPASPTLCLPPVQVPLPAAFEKCGVSAPYTSRGALRCRRRPRDADALNYGSEDDEDDDEDSLYLEDSLLMSLPRTQRILFDDDIPPRAETLEAESLEPLASAVEHEPRSMFNFVWRDFPSPPVLPTERREEFSETNCGPTAPFLTPYDAFTAIWSRDFMEYIVRETNKYAQQLVEKMLQDGTLGPNSRINYWRDTDVDELYVYFALTLTTGMLVKGDLAEYWTSDEILSTPCFGRCMTINRYTLLSRCLHFNENRTDTLKLTRPEAKIFKIAPIVSHLNEKFQSLYRLGRNIALDESLTQWKGCLDIKQYIRNKAASVGIKTYEVCESQTGYLWRFKVHAGREEATESEVTPVSGIIPTLVLELLKGLENKGRTVWMDNYYNSPALARVLKSRGFDCVGTLSTDRQCVPIQLAQLRKHDMSVGQISGCTSGDVDILVWRDQNRVAMISTYHGNSIHTGVGKTKPTAIHDYNVCMGGVDKKDQMLSEYPLERKRTRIWYKKLFKRLLNASVLNAFILHKRSLVPGTEALIIKHRKFRLELIRQLLSKHRHSTHSTLRATSSSGSIIRTCLSPEITSHFPVEIGVRPDSTSRERIRRTCIVCRIRTYYQCIACKVVLCLGCTQTYHQGK